MTKKAKRRAPRAGPTTLTEEPFKQGIASDLEMCRNVSKDGLKDSTAES